jgi:hypothetical protein
MGYYINETKNGPLGALGKADRIIQDENAIELHFPPPIFPQDKAVICVVSNGPFDAAAFAYSEEEMDYFNDPNDYRPKRWLLMNLDRARFLTGYSK